MRRTHKQETVIISLGGSLIVPDAIDTVFLADFKKLILAGIKKGDRFIIITGGGKTCRRYQEAAKQVGPLKSDDLDWLGIHATRLNAHLLRTIFKTWADPVIVKDPTKKITSTKKIIIAAGWKPGWSTDYVATLIAKKTGAKTLINLSNIEYVCDKDPRHFPDAKKIECISWREFRKLLPKKWDPGLNAPFDPIAAREAETLGLSVAVISGAHLDSVAHYLAGKKFIGTHIVPEEK